MRRLILLSALSIMIFGATAARASGGAVIMIPLALAAQLIGLIAEPFRCHPQAERIDLALESMEVDGAPVAAPEPAGAFYVAAYQPGRIVAALADPAADPPGAPRPQALVVPVLP